MEIHKLICRLVHFAYLVICLNYMWVSFKQQNIIQYTTLDVHDSTEYIVQGQVHQE